MINIPKQFELMGQTITVDFDSKLLSRNEADGLAIFSEKKILLRPQEYLEELQIAYFHELVHWIFQSLEESEMRDNEKLVQTFANLLYQSIKTSKF